MKQINMIRLIALALLLTILSSCGTTQQVRKGAREKQYASYAIAFYNVENLFDDEDDPHNNGDNDFLPTGPYNWTEAKYLKKLDNIALVLSKLGRDHTPVGPAFIGIAEVENARVLKDLSLRPAIEQMGLKVIHEEGPDRRGIDVAALYNPSIFTLLEYEYHHFPGLPDNPDFVTRDQLHVTGLLAGERIHMIVMHWPSRYGGSTSSYLREAAASLAMDIVKGIYDKEPNAKIVLMGDLNDDPINISVKNVINAENERSLVPVQGIYNPSEVLYNQGVGTLVYQNKWNFFDQMMVSQPLLKSQGLSYWKMEVFNRDFLITQEGKRKGYPLRTFENNSFINGYSDHFPVLIYLLKEL